MNCTNSQTTKFLQLKMNLNENYSVGTEYEKGINNSLRKKNGIFYTQNYITDFICEQTIGLLCRKKKQELDFNTITLQKIKIYQEWLFSLKIIDTACGCGAFLISAFHFLLNEHNQFSKTKDIVTKILSQNIFGIDIDLKSVEITKSIFRQYSNNLNISCGNAILLDWKTEFPEIMLGGGFDVVIGNPPYVKEYTSRQAFEGLHTHYCYQGKMDLWYFFGALALELVKKETGLIGYIAPNNWITNSGASKFRNIVLQKGKLLEFIDFGNFKVFDSAGIQTMIYVMRRTENNSSYEFPYSKIIDSKIDHKINQLFLKKAEDNRFTYFTTKIEKENFLDKPINFINANSKIIIDKIALKQNFTLTEKELANAIIPNPDYLNNSILKKIPKEKVKKFNLKSGDGVFVVRKDFFKTLNEREKQYLKPLIEATEVERYYFPAKHTQEIIYFTKKNFNGESCPTLVSHLEKFKEVMLERRETKSGQMEFFHIHWARNEKFFKDGSKILSIRKCKIPTFVFTEKEAYVTGKFYVLKTDSLNMKYLTALLNSKLIAFWLKHKGKMQGDNYQIDKEPLLALPIIEPSQEKQTEIAEFVTQIIENKQKEIDYNHLLQQAKKENNFDREIKLTKELENINETIQTAENKINSKVYELYELTNNEISAIEYELILKTG